jgi:hypothetical protein
MVERQTGKGLLGQHSISCIGDYHRESRDEIAEKVNIHERLRRASRSLHNTGKQVKQLGNIMFKKRSKPR